MLDLQKIKLTEGKQKMHPVSFTGKRLATVFRAVAKNLSNDIETTQTDLENAILFRANGLVKACGESFQFDRIERTDADGREAYTLTNADGEKLTAFVGTSEKAIFTTSRRLCSIIFCRASNSPARARHAQSYSSSGENSGLAPISFR